MAIIEAMTAGLAVIASRVGGNPDLIEAGVNGLLVEPGDVAGLAAALKWLVTDPVQRLALGRAAQARIAQDFMPTEHARRYEAEYQRAIASAATRTRFRAG